MLCLEATLSSLAENIALDEALLLTAEAGQSYELLRLWEWPAPAVVLGAGCRLAEDAHESTCLADGVPILRRSSGGGTVLLGSGCLVFSLVLSYERSPLLREIRSSYCYILGRLREALADLLPGITCAGTSDLAADGLKFSGNAQQRKRHHLLHHGTLLYAFDIDIMSRYLRMPSRQPDYRFGRGHTTFVRDLPTDAEDLKRRLREAWGATTSIETWPRELVQQLVREKYGKAEWNRRR
jgi:lipoate-protein ligase A